MSMKLVLQAITSLIVDNTLSVPGIITILGWLIVEYLLFRKMFRDRDWFYVLYILLTTMIGFCFLSAAPAVVDFVTMVFNKF